ncbi:addiction module HigA family antidote [Halomonas alkaliantarctica]|jgi:addiction module HigA family antidote|nr:HigA family addiction module antitoxin [uncultured Halomonas sp.]TDV98780.1 addiction module HigA family antidote [Halomonas alkaliantarctica]
MTRNGMRPIHPGEILREEYLEPLEMSVNALSKALHVPATRMNEIVRENRGITADTAMRLARYFGTSERFWLNLQTEYALRQAQITKADQVAREIEPHAA